MPGWLSNDVIAAWLAELVAALFAAAVTLSFRRGNPRADLLPWGWAWVAGAVSALSGLVAYSLQPTAAQFVALRSLARTTALLQATGFLLGARRLAGGEGVPSWIRTLALGSPLLGLGSVLVSTQPLPALLDLTLRAMASVAVGAASLAAAASILRQRGAQPAHGIRLMGVSLSFYAVLKLFSPTTLGWLGLLEGAGPALYIGFSLAPAAFALGCVVSLLEDRERVLAAERDRLRTSEEKFTKLFRSSPDAILLTRPLAGDLIVDVNESFEALSGHSRAEAIGKTTEQLGLLTQETLAATVREALAGSRLRDRELAVVTRHGQRRVFSVSAEWIDIEGEPHTIVVARDVTERKQAEETIRRSEELFRAVVEDQTEMIVRWKPDGTRTFVNQAYCRVFGGRPQDMVGTNFLSLVAEEYRAKIVEKVRSLTPAQPVATDVHEGVTATGERRWQQWTDRGIFDAQGRLIELQSTGQDITERRRVEEALHRSERLATVGALVAGVAHEVRTPLFGITATLDVYETDLDEPGQHRDLMPLLRAQVNRLSALMHDLLDYGRPRALQLARGGIEGPIQRALRSCARQAEQSGVTLAAELGSFHLERDPGRLEQVFENLLSNAISHSPRGATVRVRVGPGGGLAPGVRCTVEDEGAGIREEDLPRVFEPFFSRRRGGTGLGLAIVQRIVEDHGGSVRAANRAGGGAVFTVSLPALAGSSVVHELSSVPEDASRAH